MSEESAGVLRCDQIDRLGDGLLDRREVGRVGRQKDQETFPRFDERRNLRIVVDAEVIGRHDLARAQCGREHLADEGAEGGLIDRARETQRRLNPVGSTGADQCRGRAVVAGDRPNGALAVGSTGVETGQGARRTSLVDRDPISRVEVEGKIKGKGGTQSLVPLGCPQRLFFRVCFKRRMMRPMVHWLTRTPWVVSHAAACSAKVASRVCCTWAVIAATSPGPIRAGRPGAVRGGTWPSASRWAT